MHSMPEHIFSVTDHGVWRGRRRWTVRMDGPTGPAQVEAIDVETEARAIEQALETYRNRRVFTPEEREALRRTNDALRKGLS